MVTIVVINPHPLQAWRNVPPAAVPVMPPVVTSPRTIGEKKRTRTRNGRRMRQADASTGVHGGVREHAFVRSGVVPPDPMRIPIGHRRRYLHDPIPPCKKNVATASEGRPGEAPSDRRARGGGRWAVVSSHPAPSIVPRVVERSCARHPCVSGCQ